MITKARVAVAIPVRMYKGSANLIHGETKALKSLFRRHVELVNCTLGLFRWEPCDKTAF